jgi:hypothetical protein
LDKDSLLNIISIFENITKEPLLSNLIKTYNTNSYSSIENELLQTKLKALFLNINKYRYNKKICFDSFSMYFYDSYTSIFLSPFFVFPEENFLEEINKSHYSEIIICNEGKKFNKCFKFPDTKDAFIAYIENLFENENLRTTLHIKLIKKLTPY